MKKIDTYWLYFHHKNVDSIFRALDRAKLPEDFEIKLMVIMCKRNLFDLISEWTPNDYEVKVLEKNENLLTFRITRTIKYIDEIKTSGTINLLRYGNSNIYISITYEDLKFVNKVMLKFFNHYYSDLSRIYIASNQIKKILDDLTKKVNGEVITDRVIAYSRIKKKFTDLIGRKRRLKESDLRWTEEDYKESFQKAAEQDQWIDKITFSVICEKKELFYGYLSRDGLFKCNKNLKLFFETILSTVSNIGSKNMKTFVNKSRIENKGEIRPISIGYTQNIFKDVEQNKKLINAISEFPKSSFSVYHGNPYVHMSVVDYLDGSSYDLWVLSDNEIILVPQLKASFSSISRLIEHIFKRFREGEVKEYVIS